MKIVVGISGGVDSAIAAYILSKEGHDVIGVYFNFCDKTDKNESLHSLSEKLGIEIYEKDYRNEFSDKVIKYFVDEYKKGCTPNPCAYCNGNMKFKMLYDAMIEYGADKMATGHYANVGYIDKISNGKIDGTLQNEKRYFIKKSKNVKKDQSYMLYTLTQVELSYLIFPIGDMEKDEVRKIAKEIGLSVAEKKDSQDVCFIKDIDYAEYIKEYDFGDNYRERISRGELSENEILSKPYYRKGEFVSSKGKVLGYHEGIINYTIGQRKGLNIAFGERKFVLEVDAENNQVMLGDNDELFSSDFKVKDVIYQKINEKEIGRNSAGGILQKLFEKIGFLKKSKYPLAKLRYRHDGTLCRVKKEEDGTLICHLLNPVRAITKGQSAVFYDRDGSILFGGIIIRCKNMKEK